MTTLHSASIDLPAYVDEAQRLNEIDERRRCRVQAAVQITAQMKE